MRILGASLNGFRNLHTADFSFSPRVNLVLGRNGEGKTNLLEALNFFSLGRSHRGSRNDELIGFDQDNLHVRLEVEEESGDTLTCVAAYVITADDLLVPSVTNTATVTGTPNAGTLDPVTTTETIESRLTDLRITKTDSASTYTPGTPTTYIITVTNAGVVDVVGALVEDTLPAGVTLDGSWSCTVTGGTASCISGQPAGTSASGTGDISQLVDLSAGGELQFSVPAVYSEDPLAY